MMMNLVALWILFSTIGAANVMFPDQSLTKTSAGEHLEGAEGAAEESLRHVLEAARQSGEEIRERVSSASHFPRKTADAVHHFGVDVAQAVMHGSQSGLEKIGLARPEEKSYSEIVKEDVINAYDRTKDATGNALEATGDKVGETVSAAKDKVTDTAGYAKEKGSEKMDMVRDSASGISQSVQDNFMVAEGKAAEIVRSISQTLRENFNVAEDKASEIARSVYDHAVDILKGSAEETELYTTVDPSISSYKDKINHGSEQAADMVRNKATEAASVLPNVGQGLAYSTKNTNEMNSAGDLINNAERIAAEEKKKSKPGVLEKLTEYVKGVEHADESYYECTKDQLSGSAPAVETIGNWKEHLANKASSELREAEETVRQTKYAAEDMARDNAGKFIDATQSTKHDLDERFSDIRAETSAQFFDARDNLTQASTDAAYTLKSRTLAYFQRLQRIAADYFLLSCRTAHLFVFCSVYGSSLWVTFLSGYLLARSIPRQQFGFVQSRVFPAYLRVAATGQAVCLVLLMIRHPWSKADRDEKLQHLDLLTVLVLTLVNIFFLEPAATKAMFQKLKTEKEEGRGQDGFAGSEDAETKARMAKIDNKLSNFHAYSSMANLLSLIGMTWHLWHLSGRLVL
ncbi:unnamed protein product [Calypogeia fissa]